MYYGTEMNALNFGSKRNSSKSWWNNICWNRHCTGGGIQYLMSHVQLDFLVLRYKDHISQMAAVDCAMPELYDAAKGCFLPVTRG